METTDVMSGHMTSVMWTSLYKLIRTEALDCLLNRKSTDRTGSGANRCTRPTTTRVNFYRLKTGMFVLFVD